MVRALQGSARVRRGYRCFAARCRADVRLLRLPVGASVELVQLLVCGRAGYQRGVVADVVAPLRRERVEGNAYEYGLVGAAAEGTEVVVSLDDAMQRCHGSVGVSYPPTSPAVW